MKRKDDFRIVTYFPAWAPERADRLRYDVLTHVIYAFAIPTEEGGLLPLDHAEFAKRLVAEAHANDTLISVAVGGWSWKDIPLEPTFVKATETDEKVEKLSDAIVSMVEEYGFDGADMDWEHPRVADGSGKRYEKLMLRLSEKLHSKGKYLSAAVIGGVDANGNPGGIDTGGADVGNAAMAQSEAVLSCIDWLNVMAYDGPGDHHASWEYALNSTRFWKDVRKMPADRIALGVPFYAQAPGGNFDNLNRLYPDEAWKVDFMEKEGRRYCYNGIPTIERKTRYAKEHLGGIMIWEAGGDTLDEERSLLAAIGRAADSI